MTSYYDGVGFLAICGKAESPEPLQFVPQPRVAPPRRTRLNEFAPYPTFRHTPAVLQRPNQHPYLTHQPAHYTPHGIAASGPSGGPGGPAPGPGGGPPPAPPQQQVQQQQQQQMPVASQSPVSQHLGGAPAGTPPLTAAMSPVPRQQLPRAPQQQVGTPGGAGFSAEVAVAVGAQQSPEGLMHGTRATPSPNMRALSMTPRRDSLPGNTSSGSATPRHSASAHKSGRISTAMHPDPKQQYKTEECNICGRPFKGPKASTHKQQHIRRLHPESYMPKRGGKKKVDNRENSVESMPPSQSQSPQQSGGGGFYSGDLANVANVANAAMQFPQ
ncbi:hypothetical protein B0I72DRAFT_141529 [Yarrowia lipolytica]|nr:hypothetical protein B0I72DRAFT_141529 [Yarrowia lipolytica]RDW36208.1 hypothetical protein B0I73DRAFT_137495 [Yarrowia lipolytica]RDW44871.1 hypothetical protein B0I74DRAFT_139742 [Yarrowia lipolytica]RDW51699.1 hypothetical protein B0I75DRAFT_139479 [Yarrowia lipolytica]